MSVPVVTYRSQFQRKLITEGFVEWDPLQPFDEWGPLQVERIVDRQSDSADLSDPDPVTTHTHDGSGASSTVVGGTAEDDPGAPTASAAQTVAIGDRAQATSALALAIGSGDDSDAAPIASGDGSISIGSGRDSFDPGPRALSNGSIAIGSSGDSGVNSPRAGGHRAIAIGEGADAGAGTGNTNRENIAIGYNAAAGSLGQVVIGTGAASSTGADGDVCIGGSALTNGTGSDQKVAVGEDARATANGAVAVGGATRAQQGGDAAFGFGATTDAKNQVMLGTSSKHVKMPGGQRVGFTVQTGTTYTALHSDYLIVGNNGTGLTVTLPAATGSGQHLIVKNINATNLTVATDATGTQDNIDGSTANRTLAQYEVLEVIDYATDNWALLHVGAP